MTRIVGIHEVELKPGVTTTEFEQAVRTAAALKTFPGWQLSLIKGDRATRRGKYGLLFEVESVEARDQVVTDDGFTEVFKQFDAEHPEFGKAWDQIMSLVVDAYPWTDYQVL